MLLRNLFLSPVALVCNEANGALRWYRHALQMHISLILMQTSTIKRKTELAVQMFYIPMVDQLSLLSSFATRIDEISDCIAMYLIHFSRALLIPKGSLCDNRDD